MIESDLKLGVLSRRAPICQSSDLGTTLEHVGGLTRVLPALAEFAEIAWTSFIAQSQVGLPKKYSFSNISGHTNMNEINIFLTEVDDSALIQSDWFCANFIWPLLHDLPISELSGGELDLHFESINEICQEIAAKSANHENYGYLVNDFQLSQVPVALRNLEPEKPISFFLHTPWPKAAPSCDSAIKVLSFLATGMLAADVIEFQTQNDLQAFEKFAIKYLPLQISAANLKVNPVSVNVQDLLDQLQNCEAPLPANESEISYVHIARSDPIKNTIPTIKAFTALVQKLNESKASRYLDLFIVPSRQQWPEYQELLSSIEKCVVACNTQLARPDYVPVRLHVGNDYRQAIKALNRYDYLVVCSVADGLNLVVKEGAILNSRDGVIVSSPNVGAMAELGSNCVVSEDETADSIAMALLAATKLRASSRAAMSTELKRQIAEFDASYWAASVISDLKILEPV